MKKYFLIFTLVILMLFASCAVNTEKTRTKTGVLQDIIGTFELSEKYSGIKGKLLLWKYFKRSSSWYEDAIDPSVWPVYPAEMISEHMIGRKIRITYEISETIPGPFEEILIIDVKKIEILKKKGD